MSLQQRGRLSSAQSVGLLAILLVFGLLYASVSLVNHYNFRTSAMDLAYYHQALYDYSQFRYNHYTLNDAAYFSTLGDHWEPILVLIAPLRYLLGNQTLLWVQIFALLWGGLGIFRFVQLKTDRAWMPHLALLHFFGMWAAYSALSFDFHASVLGAMFVPWIFVWFERRRPGPAVLVFVLFAMCAEKMALWGFFIGTGLAMIYWRERQLLVTGLALGILSLVYFWLILNVFMPPHIKPGFTYRHANFPNFGESPAEIFLNAFKRPAYSFSLFWHNFYVDKPQLDMVKVETWKMIFLSGGLALLVRPKYLYMFLPLAALNMFGTKTVSWTINHHYSIEFMPLLSLALFGLLTRVQNRTWAYGLAAFSFLLCFSATLVSFSTRYKYSYVRERTDFLYAKHWKRDEFEPREVSRMLELIPDQVKVSASSTIAAHLAMRDTLYQFPEIGAAEYVISMKNYHTYPLNKAQTAEKIAELLASGDWYMLDDNEVVTVLRRNVGQQAP